MSAYQNLTELISTIVAPSQEHVEAAATRLDSLTKPVGSLGRLESLAIQLASIQRTDRPHFDKATVLVCAGDHGVVAEGVTSFPSEVTVAMVANFAQEGAAVNQISKAVGVDVEVYDVGVMSDTSFVPSVHQVKVGLGTANMCEGPAMSREQACEAMLAGVDAVRTLVEKGASMVCIGEMGIGNSTSAAALTVAFTGATPEQAVGRGAGLDDAGMAKKRAAITRALEINNVADLDPIGVLAAMGGFEIAMMAGIVMGAALCQIPVITDGFIAGSAVLAATSIAPLTKGYVVFSHRSVEPGHTVLYRHFGTEPLFDLDLRLGEGTGAVLAVPFVRAASQVISGMATFAEAGIEV